MIFASIIMGDAEGPKAKTIPSWQMKDTTTSEDHPKTVDQPTDEKSAPDSRESLIHQASRFLEDEGIRDAPVERKRDFLGSKGLSEQEISNLLQEEQEEVEYAPEAEVMEDYGIDKEEVAQLQSARRASSTPKQSTSTTQSGDTLPPSKDVPPIITYPEFLIHSHKPPPLVTARRLLTTLYVSTGAAATVYGTSKHIVEPMIEALSVARHSLSETACTNLDILNSKLENAVSKLPETLSERSDAGSDVESVSSDPARFFNRSAATQTSPHLSRSTSASSVTSQPILPIQSQENTINEIYKQLADFADSDATSSIKSSISDLQHYLEGLPQENSTQNRKMWEKPKSDEYTKLKAEIRGVKGVLLSAKNFPSSAAVR